MISTSKEGYQEVERIQRTKMVPELRDLEYEERLKVMGENSNGKTEGRELITMYKIVNRKDKLNFV